MSLKGKLAVLATEKIAEKVIPKGSVDNAVNAVLNKIGKANGQKTTSEHIQNIEKNYLIIKSTSFSVGSIAGMLAGKLPKMTDDSCTYQIADVSGEIKYRSTAGYTVADSLDLYDSTGRKVGYVKEHLISIGMPLFEKEVKKCSVYLEKEKIAEIKKYICFGDLYFDVLEGDYKIKHTDGKRFKIYSKERLMATLHDVPLNLKDGYADKFVMEYDDPSDETVAILLATAIDLIKA